MSDSPLAPVSSQSRAVVFLLIAAVLWSTGGLLIKSVDMHPLALAGVRSGLAAGLQLVWIGRFRPTFSLNQLVTAGCYAGALILFVAATRSTTAANAILLQYTSPVYIAVLAPRLCGEKTTALDWLTVGLCLIGMSLFFFDQLTPAGLYGNLLAIASGVFYALLAMFMRRQKNARPVDSVILGNIVVAVIGLPFLSMALPEPRAIVALCLLGFLQTGAAYMLYARAITRVTAIEATLILILEPLLNPVWVLLLVGERPGGFALIGGALVLGAITARGLAMARRA